MAENKEKKEQAVEKDELELDFDDLEQVAGGSFKDNIRIKETTDVSKDTKMKI